jgi:hypothetical protein
VGDLVEEGLACRRDDLPDIKHYDVEKVTDHLVIHVESLFVSCMSINLSGGLLSFSTRPRPS